MHAHYCDLFPQFFCLRRNRISRFVLAVRWLLSFFIISLFIRRLAFFRFLRCEAIFVMVGFANAVPSIYMAAWCRWFSGEFRFALEREYLMLLIWDWIHSDYVSWSPDIFRWLHNFIENKKSKENLNLGNNLMSSFQRDLFSPIYVFFFLFFCFIHFVSCVVRAFEFHGRRSAVLFCLPAVFGRDFHLIIFCW